MNIDVMWDNPQQTAMRWEFSDDWTWEDIIYAWQQTQKLMPQIDIIGDFSHCQTVPLHFPSASFIENTFANYVNTDSLVILSGCNEYITQFILQWLDEEPVLRQIIAFVETLDEARLALDYTHADAALSETSDYDIHWQLIDKVLYIKLSSDLSPALLREFNDEVLSLLNSVEGRICIIWDFATLEIIRGNVLTIREKLTFVSSPKLVWLIILSANSLIKFSIEILSQLSHISPLYHDSIEEALSFLVEIGFLTD